MTPKATTLCKQQIDRNYSGGKADILCILNDEFTRIKADPKLKYLLEEEESK